MKPGLYITRRLPASVEARARRDYDVRQDEQDRHVGAAEIVAGAAGAAAVLCCPAERLGADVIEALPESVKVIGTFSVGLDHLDLAAARARGIAVVHTPDVLSVATAELTMLLILAAARRGGEGERVLRAGGWPGWCPTQMMGTLVSGRRLGIYGMGRIGREVARMAAGFGMAVHYHNRRRLAPELEAGAEYHAEDATFLAASEVLSLNAPGGEGTRHWLDARRIGMLPRGAIVANAARGTLIDDDALIAALGSGQVAAAGLDVYHREPEVDARYVGLENVVLLPHMGSATVTTRDAMGMLVLDGIDAALAGRPAANLVA